MTGDRRLLAGWLKKAAGQLRYLPRAIALVWQAARGWTTAWALLLVVQGLLPIATVYLSRSTVNAVVAVFRAQGNLQSVRQAIVPAALMGGVLLLGELLSAVFHWIRAAQAELVQDHVSGLIHRQSLAADLAFYEMPEFYDHLHRARSEALYRPVALLDALGSLVQNGITWVAMGAVLIRFGFWIPVALVCGTLPALWVVVHYAIRQHDWRLRHTADERRALYYEWLLTSGNAAAEVRLFDLGQHFRSAFEAVRARLRHERLDVVRSQMLAELGAAVAALALGAAALSAMLWRAVLGLISLGDLAFFYQAFQQGLRLTRSLLENAGQLYVNVLFLGNLFEFLALEPKVVSPPSPRPAPLDLQRGIRFTNVRFHYPGSARLALNDFSLFVPAGRIVAIVGPNGAGKSTLLKLLCRFYDPEAGAITIDDVDLRELAVDDLRQRLTALFQEPLHHNATARENIALGDLLGAPSAATIATAAEAAGADTAIRRLPVGYDTVLGKWFADGTELSVGEWQRVALARALVRPAPVIILDEPTSAMDPWAEAGWLTRFRGLVAGRTAIVITHRFTTAMLADEVHVMDNGRILESGTHQHLIAGNGRYAAWWAAQERSARAAAEEDARVWSSS